MGPFYGCLGVVIRLFMAYSDIASYIKDFLINVTQQNGVIINEYVIERYVRFRDTMDEATQHAVGECIKKYASGQYIERFYSQFYEEFDKTEHVPSSVHAFAATLFD